MKVVVDKDTCIGCGLCISMVPEVFEMGSDGKSNVKVEEVPKELEDDVKKAAELCPVGAIKIIEE